MPEEGEALSKVRPCILTYLRARGSSQWRHCAPEIWAGRQEMLMLLPSYGIRALYGVPDSISYTVTCNHALQQGSYLFYTFTACRKPYVYMCEVHERHDVLLIVRPAHPDV